MNRRTNTMAGLVALLLACVLQLGPGPGRAATEPSRGSGDLIFASGFENRRPLADAGVDRVATRNQPTTLDGSSSSDPDGDALIYNWQVQSQPAGSAIALTGTNTAAPAYTPTHLGQYQFGLSVSDGALASTPDSVSVTVVDQVLPPIAVAGAARTVLRGSLVTLDGSASSDPQVRPLSFAWVLELQPEGSSATLVGPATSAPSFTPVVAGLYRVGLVVSNGLLDSVPDVIEITALPPPPAQTATPVELTEITAVGDSTRFLYTGPDAVQTGVAGTAVSEQRAAVVRGRVLDRKSMPIPGATVRVLGRPELGSTLTQQDGRFDLAINGGGQVVLEFVRDGRLTVQRRASLDWNTQKQLPDVVMIPPDPVATRVDLSRSSGIQVVRGSRVVDSAGVRQGTLLVPPSLRAEMRLPGGARKAVLGPSTFRVTEYSEGASDSAMPGELPATTSYTYAAELSLDEALAAGATRVDFDQPIAFYVDNFRKFPVGSPVPLAYYDRERAEWIPAANGRVVKLLAIASGSAILDVSGSGNPATAGQLEALGIDGAELKQLAALYTVGKELWRSRIDHFTPWDCNWPYVPPAGSEPPRLPPPAADAQADDAADKDSDESEPGECPNAPGSVIQCQKQTLHKLLPIAGTPYSLHYNSERTPGWQSGNTINIPLSGATLPTGVRRIELDLQIAGRRFQQTFDAAPNLSHIFTWDGRDAYGRLLGGSQEAVARVGYTYAAVYAQPGEFPQSFSTLSGVPITGNRARNDITLWQEHRFQMGAPLVSQVFGIGGWSLSAHHFYDPNLRTLFQGNGELRAAAATISEFTVATLAGNGTEGFAGDGGPAVQAAVNGPRGIATAADGSVYFADTLNHRIRRVAANGVMTTVAGTGTDGFSGDGGSATSARLFAPSDVAVAADGALVIADTLNHRIRVVAADGVIRTVAGDGQAGFAGDGTAALLARLNNPSGVALGPYGDIYIADTFNHRVRRIGADGMITTVAGTGVAGYNGDNQPAVQAQLQFPLDLEVGRDGDQYVVDNVNHRIRRINVGGVISTVAGTGEQGLAGDGGLAIEAKLAFPRGLALQQDGSLLLVDASNRRLRRVNGEGLIETLIGGGNQTSNGSLGLQYRLQFPSGIAAHPDGGVVLGDTAGQRLLARTRFLPRFSAGELLIASTDGAEIYRFSATGRHLETIDTHTRATLYSFGYDAGGRLARITDGDGDVTTVERNPAGVATAIVSMDGQRTDLTLAGGQLTALTNPNSEVHGFSYTASGLLATATSPRALTSTYNYDSRGRLSSVADAADGGLTLARSDLASGHRVTRTSTLGRVTRYDVTRQSSGQERTSLFPDGSQTLTRSTEDGQYTSTLPDGTLMTRRIAADPRFGMQSAFAESQQTSTGSRTLTSSLQRTVLLGNTSDPLSLEHRAETFVINGRSGSRDYEAATRTWTLRTPGNRSTRVVVDSQSRPLRSSTSGLADVRMIYDSRGRLAEVASGSGADERRTLYAYGPDGYLQSITDPLLQVVAFERDAVGRVERLIRPDDEVTTFDYDPAGNLSLVQPPGRPAHRFEHTAVELVARYRPPAVTGSGSTDSVYSYNLDRQPTRAARADGRMLDYGYDSVGRLGTMTLQRGSYTLSYQPSTSQLAGIAAPGGINLGYTYSGGLLTRVSWSGPMTGQVDYGYDNDFRVSSISVNGGSPVSFGYDPDSLLTSAGNLTLTYDPDTALLRSTTLGSITDSYVHNPFGEVASYHASQAGNALFSEVYTRDKLGRITRKVETVAGATRTLDYDYDLAGRLIEVQTDGAVTAAYVYDSNGNRLSRTAGASSASGSYDDQDRMTAYGGASYTYSAEGDLQTRTLAGQTSTYDYDELGNLLAVSLPGGTTISYRIDGQNRRIGKLVNGSAVQGFLYQDQLEPVAELNGSGALVARFVYADKAHTPAYMIKSGQTYRFITDQLGSPRLLVNIATGQVAQRIDYDEFGNVTLDSSPGFQPFGYAGGIDDRDTGLVRFGARDYDPNSGRWATKDSSGFAGGDTNLFLYSAADPINFSDATGLSFLSDVHSGVRSYVDGIYGTGRYIARRSGALGAKEQCEAKVEGEILNQAIDFILDHPKFAGRAVLRYAFSHPGAVLGRQGAGFAVAKLAGAKIAGVVTAISIHGSVRNAIEKGADAAGVIQSVIGAEVNPLSNTGAAIKGCECVR